MTKKTLIGVIIGGVLIAGASFAGGYLLRDGSAGDSPRGALSELNREERAQLRDMSDAERQAFLKEKGIDPSASGTRGLGGGQTNGAAGSGRREQVLEGTIASVDSDRLSLALSTGGTARVYLDVDTLLAAAEGAIVRLALGAEVLVVANREAEGVTGARAIIVK
jgi:hypothetical protein